jgi:phenylalanyl-tRNA synthetase beta chain
VPRSTLSLRRVLELLPPGVTDATLEELLFSSKAEVERRVGDELELSVTPDRLDLLSEGGLGLYLQGALGSSTGLPKARRSLPTGEPWTIRVDASVESLRPTIAGIRIRAPGGRPLDEGLLAEAVRFQEILHATVGRDRRVMSLGIYPADRLKPPIRYSLESVSQVKFVPLYGSEEVSGADFLATDPMAQRYGSLGSSDGRCLTLRDDAGSILSLPPVLNSRGAGEARPGDRELLLESTGTRARAVREGLGLLLVVFVARGWAVAPVAIEGADGSRDEGVAVLEPHEQDLAAELLDQIAGTPLGFDEVAQPLARARLGVRRIRGGFRVTSPPWRPDLLGPVDIAEEVVLARGVRSEDGIVPASPTRGHRRAETDFRRRIAALLLGLGFTQPHTPLLVSEACVGRLAGGAPIRLRNPVSAEFAFVRDRLLLSHLDVLAHNTRRSYPQRFAEVAPVVVRSPEAEAGAETRSRAGLIVASERAGFADVAALVEYLLGSLDVGAVREPAELPGTIPGRAARARVAGEIVAEMGEIHPRILAEIGVPVPSVWAELDLSALWPLVARRDTD